MGAVTNAVWFGKIGIVQIVQNEQWETYQKTGDADYKYYIGDIGDGPRGDEQNDRQAIACFGMPFDVAAGDKLFRVERPLKNDWKWDWQ